MIVAVRKTDAAVAPDCRDFFDLNAEVVSRIGVVSEVHLRFLLFRYRRGGGASGPSFFETPAHAQFDSAWRNHFA
jgi:hypothetical protein